LVLTNAIRGWRRGLTAASRLIATIAFILIVAPASLAETRALLISQEYGPGPRTENEWYLPNAHVDADRISDSLRKVGVKDIRRHRDISTEQLADIVAKFAASLSRSDTALVYYSGHAIQVGGLNYFIDRTTTSGVAIDSVLNTINAKTTTIFLLDACRNNPFAEVKEARLLDVVTREVKSISIADLEVGLPGLAQMSDVEGSGTLVFFSTNPGNRANDGEAGKGSPFANAVAAEIGRRQSFAEVVRKVTERVERETTGEDKLKQSPWPQGNIPDLYLAGKPRFPVP
jgi:uncharacterized caspase-like protein